MNYKIIVIFGTVLLFFSSCTTSKKSQIEGKILNNEEIENVRLINLENNEQLADIPKVRNAQFNFNIDLKKETVLKIQTNDYKVSEMLLFYEPDLSYTIKINNTEAIIQAPKNSLQDEYNKLLKKLTPLNEKLTHVSQDTTMSMMQLDTLSTQYFNDILKVKKRHIQEYPESHVSLYLLKEMSAMEALSYHELQSLFKIMDNEAHNEETLLNFVEGKLETIQEDRIVDENAPEFTLKNPDGKEFTLQNFKGHYTLIDFWASWCAPCRVANKKISPLYSKYKENGFKIVSISFDDDKDTWVKAIKDDQMPWVQLSDLKGFNKSPIKDLYKVQSLPTTYLISPDGKVVDQHLSYQELGELLESIYKN